MPKQYNRIAIIGSYEFGMSITHYAIDNDYQDVDFCDDFHQGS